MKTLIRSIGAVLVAGAACGEPAGTTDWPEFRGPTGQGISSAKNPPKSWGRENGVAWSREVPGGWSSPMLAGDTLYACTEDGVCYVVEVSKKRAEVVSEIDMEERIFASPAVVDGALYLRGEEHLWKIVANGD